MQKKIIFYLLLFIFVISVGPMQAMGSPTETYLGKNYDTQFTTALDTRRQVKDAYDAFYVPYMSNPAISDSNVSDPHAVKWGGTSGGTGVSGLWYIYTSKPGTGGKEIFRANTSKSTFDLTESTLNSLTQVVPRGIYSNVTEPSIVIKGTPFNYVWYMAVTVQRADTTNWISVLTSYDGITWNPLTSNSKEIILSGATFTNISGSTLLYNEAQNRFELYFQGLKSGDAAVTLHLAYSPVTATPLTFTYQQSVGDMIDADVKVVNNIYVAAYRNLNEAGVRPIRYSTSTDGKAFTVKGVILNQDGLVAYDNQGVEKPNLIVEGDEIIALLYAGGDTTNYNNYKIGIAYPQSEVTFKSGAVSHVNRQSINAYAQRVSVGAYAIDRIVVRDKPGGSNTIDKAITSKAGNFHSIMTKYFLDHRRLSAWASSELPGYPASNGIDSNNANMYSSAIQGSANSVVTFNVDLGNYSGSSGVQINRIRIVPRGDSLAFPKNFSLETSFDALSWTPIPGQTYTDYPTPPVGGAEIVFAFDKVQKGRYVRLNATVLSTDGTNYLLQLAEFYVDTHNARDWGNNVTSGWTVQTSSLIYNYTNLYNARVVKTTDPTYPYRMWIFGVAAGFTNDKIYAARSAAIDGPWQVYKGGGLWDTTMNSSLWVPVLQAGSTNYDNTHNGDPSVVLLSATYYMAFSSVGLETITDPDGVARQYIRNCIMGATSTDGINWTKSTEPILIWDKEYTEGWDSNLAPPSYGGYHRPSLMYDGGKWKMWFDYYHPGYFLVTGYAENSGNFMTKANWNVLRKDSNPVMKNWVNPSIAKVGTTYYAFSDPDGFNGVLGPHRQLAMQTSTDGLSWTLSGYLKPETDNYVGTHVPEAYVENIGGTNYLYVFYSWQPGSHNPYDANYKAIRYLKKAIP